MLHFMLHCLFLLPFIALIPKPNLFFSAPLEWITLNKMYYSPVFHFVRLLSKQQAVCGCLAGVASGIGPIFFFSLDALQDLLVCASLFIYRWQQQVPENKVSESGDKVISQKLRQPFNYQNDLVIYCRC